MAGHDTGRRMIDITGIPRLDFCAAARRLRSRWRIGEARAHSLRPCRDLRRPERRSTVLSDSPQVSVYLDHNLGYATPIAALLLCKMEWRLATCSTNSPFSLLSRFTLGNFNSEFARTRIQTSPVISVCEQRS